MMLRKSPLMVVISALLWCVTIGLVAEAQPRRPSHHRLKLIRIEPLDRDVLLVFRVPDRLDLRCPLQMRIGDLSVTFREVQDLQARIARFVVSRELYRAIDNRRHDTVIRGCVNAVTTAITYPRLVEGGPVRRPHTDLKLIRIEPLEQDVVLVFRVPDGLDLGCPLRLRIGDLSVAFREVQDRQARIARFVVSRELYQAIDNRRHDTVISSCSNAVTTAITYPRLVKGGHIGPRTELKLLRIEPLGQDVLLVFHVPAGLDLGCPLQLRIGDLSVTFREVQDRQARIARFVVSRELYQAIDNRRHKTVLRSCANSVENTIAYPPLRHAR